MYDEQSSPQGGAEQPFRASSLDVEDRGHPLLATIIGCGAALLIAAARQDVLASSGMTGAELAGRMTAMILVPAGVVWAAAYFATIRKAATVWKVVSLIAFILFAGVGTLAAIGAQRNAMGEDAAETIRMTEQLTRSDDPLSERLEGGKGTFSKMTAAALNSTLEDFKRFQEEFDAAGVEQVLALEGLTHNSPVLDRCDGVAGIAQRAEYYESRLPMHLAAAEAVGRRAVAAGTFPAEGVEGFLSGARTAHAGQRRQWELQAEVAREAGAICKILAARKWRNSAGTLELRDAAQIAAVNAHLGRVEAHLKELTAIQEAARKAASEALGADLN